MNKEDRRCENTIHSVDDVDNRNADRKDQAQLRRIIHMEEIYDRSCIAVEDLLRAVQAYLDMEKEIAELEQYYQSPLWLKDFDDDQAGEIPKDLKRGILTEDAIYDFLTDKYRLMQMMREIAERDSEQYEEVSENEEYKTMSEMQQQ